MAMPGLVEAINIAVNIARIGAKEMYVSYSPDGEYTSSDDIRAERVKP